MQIIVDIPDDAITDSLRENKYLLDNEEHSYVRLSLLYTENRLEHVCVDATRNFTDCDYVIIPSNHGKLIDANELKFSLLEVMKYGDDYKEILTHLLEKLDNAYVVLDEVKAEG